MVQLRLQRLIIATAIILPLAGIAIVPIVQATPLLQTQRGNRAQANRILPVALPDSAIVWLTNGNSHSGELMEFNANTLRLSSMSNPIPLAQVTTIEFGDDVWIPSPGGELRLRRIRGLSQSIDGLPASALTWNGPPTMAELNLQAGMTQGEFNKLTRDPDLTYALTRVQFGGADGATMNVRIKSFVR
jgi:hypothetical protein